MSVLISRELTVGGNTDLTTVRILEGRYFMVKLLVIEINTAIAVGMSRFENGVGD